MMTQSAYPSFTHSFHSTPSVIVWFQVFLFNINNFKQIYIAHIWNPNRYYHSGPESNNKDDCTSQISKAEDSLIDAVYFYTQNTLVYIVPITKDRITDMECFTVKCMQVFRCIAHFSVMDQKDFKGRRAKKYAVFNLKSLAQTPPRNP